MSSSVNRATGSGLLSRISALERAYVDEVLLAQFSNRRSGSMVRRLEERFAELFGVKYAIAQVNGTATLHSALAAVGVGPGDEVIVPPLTMMSTCFAVLQCNAIPVFADVDPHTFVIDPASVEAAITPRTRAVMPVALYGLSADVEALMAITRPRGIALIEDTAQCFLGTCRGQTAGTIGDMGSFSFQISKHVTSGEGGMLVTNDEELAQKARRFGTLGYASVGAGSREAKVTREVIQDPRYERHLVVGWNYRMSEPCAAIALGQIERLAQFVEARSAVAALYAEALGDCPWLIPQAAPDGFGHSWWTYVLRLASDAPCDWYEFRRRYIEHGGDGVYAAWQLNYLEPVLRGQRMGQQQFAQGLCPVAESLQPRLLQFKTNYLDLDVARAKAEALGRTVASFGWRTDLSSPVRFSTVVQAKEK